ncbi:MAG: ATP-binding protein [Bacteroidota bacterium]|nr:ATP-binding protein [Bacteroidota bacterium]
MFKYPSPKQVAVLSAFLIAVFVFSLLIVFRDSVFYSFNWFVAIAIPLLVFIFSYMIFLYTLQKFIYRKIKLIYKTISEHKFSTTENPGIKNIEKNTIEEVEQEVLKWTGNKTKEIERLKELELYRKEFLGNVSHELKTPIFNIQGYIETLIDGGVDDEKIKMLYLQRASRNVERLSKIIEDLEMISMIESGVQQLAYEKFDIYSLALEVIDSLKLLAERSDIQTGFKTGSKSGIMVYADKEKVRQVFSNLIANSIKYGNRGGQTQIGLYDMEKNILVEVSDNGIGIENQHLSRLFERFYRVDKGRTKEQGGTGLGLSIVKHIIESHRQTVNVRSTPGEGSTFGFTLRKA